MYIADVCQLWIYIVSKEIVCFVSGNPLSGPVQGDPSAEGLSQDQPIILYQESSIADLPYTTWMIIMTAVVAVVFIIQAGVGMCYCVLKRQIKRIKRQTEHASDEPTDCVSVSTVGSAMVEGAQYRKNLGAASEYNVKL